MSERCKLCGRPRGDSHHIRFGADVKNPVKHQFEPYLAPQPPHQVVGEAIVRLGPNGYFVCLHESAGAIVRIPRGFEEGDKVQITVEKI